ncbi:MAG: hypothetical protein ACKVTZ_03375 [Bacteroidia bacterium]
MLKKAHCQGLDDHPRYPYNTKGRHVQLHSNLFIPREDWNANCPKERNYISYLTQAERKKNPTSALKNWYKRAITHSITNNSSNDDRTIVKEQQVHAMSNLFLCDIQYHFIIGVNGKVYEGRPISVQSEAYFGVKGKNEIGCISIGIIAKPYTTSLDNGYPIYHTKVQIQSLEKLLQDLKEIYKITQLGNHDDISPYDKINTAASIELRTLLSKISGFSYPYPSSKLATSYESITIDDILNLTGAVRTNERIQAVARRNANLTINAIKEMLGKYEINTPLRIAHFFAQVSQETAYFTTFSEVPSGIGYEGNEGLLNTEDGDGIQFIGRGLLHLTGRINYSKYSLYVDRDLTVDNNWELVGIDPFLIADSAGWYWREANVNKSADKGTSASNVKEVTKAVNGGENGLINRTTQFNHNKLFLNL